MYFRVSFVMFLSIILSAHAFQEQQLHQRKIRSIAKTELAYRIEKIEEKLHHLITALEPKYKLGLDERDVERSGIDLKPAMNGKLWLSQFSPETQASFKEARRLIQQYGKFALLHADQSPLEVAEVLILGGADVNLRDPDEMLENTILHKASASHNLNLIKLLYDFRADFSAKNCYNLTAWDIVVASDFHSAQDFLKNKGLSGEVTHV